MAELIRDGVDVILRARGTVDREAVKARSLAAMGRFRSGARDLGSKHDDHLADAFDRMTFVDTSALIALLDRSEAKHIACARAWRTTVG